MNKRNYENYKWNDINLSFCIDVDFFHVIMIVDELLIIDHRATKLNACNNLGYLNNYHNALTLIKGNLEDKLYAMSSIYTLLHSNVGKEYVKLIIGNYLKMDKKRLSN